MSAGNFLGAVLVSIVTSAMWIVLGAAIDKIGLIFNRNIGLLPTFQDAMNGFTITQTIWIIIPIIILFFVWLNYVLVESNEASGFV
jgi:hypothetical protein